jgi:hypothetical protein
VTIGQRWMGLGGVERMKGSERVWGIEGRWEIV